MFYRLRQAIAYRYFQARTRSLETTPALVSNLNAPCEVHTMLGAHDLVMYLVAIKSLLSYVPELAVVVHSDGSLTAQHRARIERHVRGARFVFPEEADPYAATALRDYPLLSRWRTSDAAYRRLVDIELWRRAKRVIILDSDVLTNQDPHEIRQWVQSGDRPFMLGQPAAAPPDQASSAPQHVQALFLNKVPDISARLQTKALFVQGATAGFCGYFDELSLPRVEAALGTALDLGLPMAQWGGDQCLVIYLLSVAGGERLPIDRYLNFEPTVQDATHAAVIHFYGTHRFHRLVYPTLATAVVRRLATLPEAAGAMLSSS